MNAVKLARFYLKQLWEAGVVDYVLSPGSRNAPLAIALGELESAGLINLYSRIDERSAAYFALGLSKKSKLPVALICTSGTAVANYHPAALEALHSNLPLIFLTADRPANLRLTGANQTTIQSGIFPLIKFLDVASEVSLPELNGPLQINIQFTEPLVEVSGEKWWQSWEKRNSEVVDENESGEISLPAKTVVVVGHDKGGLSNEEINNFILENNLIAISEDPLLGSAHFPHAVLTLQDEAVSKALAADTVVVIGRVTLSRPIVRFISSASKKYIIDPKAKIIDINRAGDGIFSQLPKIIQQSDQSDLALNYLELWKKLTAITGEVVANRTEWSESAAIKVIFENLKYPASLFIGSSRAIREVESTVDYERVKSKAPINNGEAKPLDIFANRGLAGIDGNISTSFGIAEHSERTYCLIGDITFLHDLSALLYPPSKQITIIVIDNNGGGIFNTLEQAGVPNFEKVFATPHNRDLASLVRGFGIPVEVVNDTASLATALLNNNYLIEVIVVKVPDRSEMVKELNERKDQLANALRIGANLA